MSFFEKAEQLWNENFAEQQKRQWATRLANGHLGLSHYKGFLIETYHNAGLNPQLQGYATMFLDGRPRNVVKKFFQHAISEIGHDILALNDLTELGVNSESIINSEPQPETSAFFANTIYAIQKNGVVSYLAYLFYLEYTPIKTAPAIMEMLKAKGVPTKAMSFLEEHATVDVQHLKLMQTYMLEVINSKSKEDLFLKELKVCIKLHSHVLDAAYENGEKLFG